MYQHEDQMVRSESEGVQRDFEHMLWMGCVKMEGVLTAVGAMMGVSGVVGVSGVLGVVGVVDVSGVVGVSALVAVSCVVTVSGLGAGAVAVQEVVQVSAGMVAKKAGRHCEHLLVCCCLSGGLCLVQILFLKHIQFMNPKMTLAAPHTDT